MIKFHCSCCGHLLEAEDKQGGKFIRCPECKATTRVPADASSNAARGSQGLRSGATLGRSAYEAAEADERSDRLIRKRLLFVLFWAEVYIVVGLIGGAFGILGLLVWVVRR